MHITQIMQIVHIVQNGQIVQIMPILQNGQIVQITLKLLIMQLMPIMHQNFKISGNPGQISVKPTNFKNNPGQI